MRVCAVTTTTAVRHPAGVGMIVASPVYAANNSEYLANFTRGDYHGTVVWSWQQAMMVQGRGLQSL